MAEIEAQERARSANFKPPVAAFDLTFSPQKSVSVAWALADRETQARMYECHRRAIEVALEYAEAHMFHSRSGTNGVLQEDVDGVVAAAFTHYDSRAGDPQLHDHVVVWNRARSRSDGKWRTLDSRGLYKQVVTLSEIYDGVLEDLLTGALGVGWRRAGDPRRAVEGRARGRAGRAAGGVLSTPAGDRRRGAAAGEGVHRRARPRSLAG